MRAGAPARKRWYRQPPKLPPARGGVAAASADGVVGDVRPLPKDRAQNAKDHA